MRSSPTAQLWQYPLSRPSWRFNYFNDYVRALDVRFAGLSGRRRGMWDRYGHLYPWAAWCLEWFYFWQDEREFFSDPVACYRNYNCMMLVQGRGVTDEPPEFATVPDHDTFTNGGSGGLSVIWAGRSVTPSGSYLACVRECSLNHPPSTGPNPSKMRFSVALPIEYGVPLDVSQILVNRPGAAYMPALAVGVSVSDVDGVTFGAGVVPFERPYS